MDPDPVRVRRGGVDAAGLAAAPAARLHQRLQLFVGLGILYGAVFIAAPTIVAPPINPDVPPGTPPIMPLLFVTIACGAISGFHGLVSSGTTSKQLNKETDARFVGYLGSLGEGTLAIVAIIAVTAASP